MQPSANPTVRGHVHTVNPTQRVERQRHPVHLGWLREQTAAAFLEASQRALSHGSAETLLAAAALSDEHNAHCRAGIPVDDAVQRARRQLRVAAEELLAKPGDPLPQRARLTAISERLATLTAEPGDRLPPVITHGKVAEWLVPEDVDTMRFAFKDKSLPLKSAEAVQRRAALVTARACKHAVLQTLSDAWDAHVDAPNDPAIELRLQTALKNAQGPMEVIFEDAHAAFLAHHSTPAPQKKRELQEAAKTLRQIARQRVAALEELCAELRSLSDASPSSADGMARLEAAEKDLRHTKTVLHTCTYVLAS